jgi:hypothetical protein
MRAFVIRGFGQKAGVDFDRVHKELIGPALREVGADGGTTGEIVEAGNIREDMFRELVNADLVVADISVQNANVFYELGIRHAVRNRATVLIRAQIDDVPFDLLTDRYLHYDPATAAASKDDLVQRLRETLAIERDDSPVFRLLLGFDSGPQAAMATIPRDLDEDIKQARREGNAGVLRLLAKEVKGLRFEEAALRAVAKASEKVGDNAAACSAWELIRSGRPGDYDANYALANVYRRLGELERSGQAIDRALASGALTPFQRAELYALRASNSKRSWRKQWSEHNDQNKARVALKLPELRLSRQDYRCGFNEDLNNWYPGLNALAMVKITLALADRCPEDWQNMFHTEAEAEAERDRLEAESAWLTSTVRASLNSVRERPSSGEAVDLWIDVSTADLLFLISDEPEKVASAYAAAMTDDLGSDAQGSIRDQIEMYRDLGIFLDNAEHALAVLPEPPEKKTDKGHALVFAGHMIDVPDRAHKRFPADREELAKAEIKRAVEEIAESAQRRNERVIGMAGALNGGDILFHEVCRELGIETTVFLPVPERSYRVVAISGPASGWADRYYAVLENAKKVLTLARTDAQPGWLVSRPEYSTWLRSNRWILHHAWAVTTDDRVTALALWNGQPGDGPGGVADLVDHARKMGTDVRIPETGTIFGPLEQPSKAAEAAPSAEAAAEDGQGGEAGTEDPVLNLVWRYHRQWSKAAGTAQTRLKLWRLGNLTLLVLGALAAAVAAQTWLKGSWLTAFAAASAVALAVAGLIQRQALTADSATRWTGARAASEALKAETFRYLARVPPYASADRTEQLQSQLTVVQDRVRDLRVEQELVTEEKLAAARPDPVPEVRVFDDYLTKRARNQANWHRDKIAHHERLAKRLRFWQLAATAAGAVLAAVAGAVPGSHLTAWTAAATTIAAALATHIAATQHERIASSYAATVDQLDRLIAAVDPKTESADRQAQFVADVERVLATQNEGWTDLLSPSARKRS